jgi:hypothetical protein
MDIVDRIENDREVRRKNLQNTFYSEHMSLPLENEMIKYDLTGTGKREIDTKDISDFMKVVTDKEFVTHSKYINDMLVKNKEDFVEETRVLEVGAVLAKQNNELINIVGIDKERDFAHGMNNINRFNGGSFTEKSVVVVPSFNSTPIKANGTPSYYFAAIDLAIDKNSTIVMSSEGFDNLAILNEEMGNTAYSTNPYAIKQFLKRLDGELDKEQLDNMSNAILLHNYLVSMGYSASLDNTGKALVMKPANIEYNDTIRNGRDLSAYLDGVLSDYTENKC